MAILLLIILLTLIISDFKSRHVYIWQLALFVVMQVVYCLLTFGKTVFLENILLSGITLLVLSFCVGLYIYLRFRRMEKVIGWGDIIFIFALTPYFTIPGFLYFMIAALVLTLAGWGIFYFSGHRSKEIPLVSTVGICYGVLLIYNSFIS